MSASESKKRCEMLNKDFVKVLQQLGWLTQGQPAQVRSALDNAERHLTAVLEPLIDRDAILCTDSASVHQKFAHLAGVTHRPTNVSQGIGVLEGACHIQNVNVCDSRPKAWMRRFQGVATDYLERYLGWRRLLERYRHTLSPANCLQRALGRCLSQ
ncbi:MAG: IS1595 family transposase [Polaromonas sp.]|nr:IS1595 family transposase [Polaromonas sp.]